jgi:hypothetical protein
MAWNATYKEFYLFVCEALFGFAAGQSAPKYGKNKKTKKHPPRGQGGPNQGFGTSTLFSCSGLDETVSQVSCLCLLVLFYVLLSTINRETSSPTAWHERDCYHVPNGAPESVCVQNGAGFRPHCELRVHAGALVHPAFIPVRLHPADLTGAWHHGGEEAVRPADVPGRLERAAVSLLLRGHVQDGRSLYPCICGIFDPNNAASNAQCTTHYTPYRCPTL